ncbi:MAG: inactive transglutaminase family protein [Deltaproteobacteria bacterium]|nr:inactive transglutaminase family protein [Deltaproteobacteria bacterium]
MNPRQLYLLCAALALAALGVFAYKHLVLGFPLQPDAEVEAWDLEVGIRFMGRGDPVKVSLLLPRKNDGYAVVQEHFVSGGYGLATQAEDERRIATWSARQASGRQSLYYRAIIRPALSNEAASARKPPRVRLPRFEGATREAADALLSEVYSRSADVESMVKALIRRLAGSSGRSQNMPLLLGDKPSVSHKAELAAQILALADIPARPVHGIRLQPLARDTPILHWLEAYHDGSWHAYDMETSERRIPKEYLAWWRGAGSLVTLSGGAELSTQVSVTLNKESALLVATAHEKASRPALFEFSPSVLPISAQAVYHVFLVVPVGVLILVIMRNLIGMRTFGTFMPVLIALAFRETRLLSGIVLFCLLVGAGLGIRFYLEQLKLLVVPRLAAVLIIVVHLMFVLDLLSHKFGLQPGLSVTLFPMVIMTMTIERLSVVWEERGPGESLKQGLGSLLVASVAYVAMNFDYLQHLFFIFPELILLVLAAIILLGRYSGYRLLELWRFKVLAVENA